MSKTEVDFSVIDKLEKYGIQAVPYKRAPLGVENFALGIGHNPEIVRVWPGRHAEISVVGDKTETQAVLTVSEPKRSITRSVTVEEYSYGGSQQPRHDSFRNGFPVALPATTTYSVKGIKQEQDEEFHSFSGLYRTFTATVTATVPASVQPILVGMDETAYFAAMLPKSAASVEQAHKSLRPVGLAKDSLRQGEWFFTPASAADVKAINRALTNGSGFGPSFNRWEAPPSPRRLSYRPLEQNSSHHATTILVNGRLFATGAVVDHRKGRHEPLVLSGWHRVVRNREVQQNPAMNRPARYWD